VLEVKIEVEVEDIMWAWHARLDGFSGWVRSLHEQYMEGDDDCFRGASEELQAQLTVSKEF
jgi:hypothetical protein